MKISASKILFYLLLLIPLSFKIEISEGIAFYPQELLMPIVLILLFTHNKASFPAQSYPYLFLFAGLTLVLVSTLISQFYFIEISGILKSLKYLFYILAIIYLPRYSFNNFLQKFNLVALLCISLTIVNYLYKFIVFEGSLTEYISLSVWDINYVPSGFSNSNFSLSDMSFSKATGNHGIYGSYLVLVFLLNFSQILGKKRTTFTSKLLILLSAGNLLMINSRESLLLFVLINALFFLKPFLKLKVKLGQVAIVLTIFIGIYLLILFEVNISMVQKITYTIESFASSGQENNISLRYSVWGLILHSFILYPYHLLIGYGYNIQNFSYYLEQTNHYFNLYKTYVTVPESIFFFFLSFGGIAAFLFVVLFFLSLLWESFKIRKDSIASELFFYFVIGVIITNNTGASMLSDLLLAQFALVYFWLIKQHDSIENTPYNSQG